MQKLTQTAYQKTSGFSLVEVIMYIAILTIVMGTLVSISISVLGTFSHLEAHEDIANSSTVALERMTREIRKANNIHLAGSILGVHPGVLILDTIDSVGNPTTVTITLSGGKILLKEGASASAPLTSGRVTISNLVFTRILSANTQGIRVELTAERVSRGTVISRNFSTFVVLDGS